MSGSLAQLTVRIGADISGLSKGIAQATGELGKLGAAVPRAIASVPGHVAGAAKGFVNLFAQIGWATQGLKAFGQGAVALGSALLGPSASLEQLRVGFTTMLGSGQKANAFLAQMQQFANKTPFEFPQVATAAQHMLAFGFAAKDVIPNLTAVGDAVSALGGDASVVDNVTTVLGQMKAAGKVNAQDMLQLTSAGIPAWQILADKMHLSVGELQSMVTRGAVPADKAISMLVSGMESKYKGMMTAQSQTFNGLLSTVSDTARTAFTTAMAPVFSIAKEGMQLLANAVSNPAFAKFANFVGQTLATGINNAIGFVKQLVPPVRDAASYVGRFVDAVLNGISPTSNLGTVGGQLVNVVQTLWRGFNTADFWVRSFFNGVVNGVGPMGNLHNEAQNLVNTLKANLGPVIQQVSGQVKQFGEWFNKSLLPALKQAWPSFQALGDTLATKVLPALIPVLAAGLSVSNMIRGVLLTAIEAVLPPIITVAGWIANGLSKALTFLSPYITQAAHAVSDFAKEIGPRLIPIIQQLGDKLNKTLSFISGVWNAVWPAISFVLKVTWDEIMGIVQIAWSIVTGIIKVGLDLLGGNWKQAWDDIKAMLSGVWDGIKKVIGAGWGAIKDLLGKGLGKLGETFGKAWDGIKSTASTKWDELKKNIGDKAGAVKDAILKPFNGAKDAIGGIVKGFANNGIKVLNDSIGGWETLANRFGDAINWVSDKLGKGKPIPHIGLPRIPMLARGTHAFAGGIALVGEEGPELVSMPRGTSVLPAGPTAALMAGNQGIPGFAGGIGDFFGSIKDKLGGALGAAENWIGHTGSWLIDKALGGLGIDFSKLPAPASIIGPKVWGAVKGWAATFLQHMLDGFAAGNEGLVTGQGTMAGVLSGFPAMNQLALRDVNSLNDCVPTAIAAALTYVLKRPYSGSQVKAAVYGSGYMGGTNPMRYAPWVHSQGAQMNDVRGGNGSLVRTAIANIQRGIPTLAAIPSNWNANTGGSTHEIAFAGWNAAKNQLIAMNPWRGFWQAASPAWWQARLRYGDVNPIGRRAAQGGIVNGPTLVGEGEGPEAVIPLKRAGDYMGYRTANIYVVMPDGRTMVRLYGQAMADEMRLKLGIKA